MTTFNHSDEMTTAYDGVCDCARHNSKPIARRAPTVEDFDVWMLEVHGASLLDEIGDDYDWNAIALGFLVARGVDPKYLDDNGWEFLASYNCGDRARMLAALAEIK